MPSGHYQRKPLSEEHKRKISESNKGKAKAQNAGCKPNDVTSLWAKVDKKSNDECWPWLGQITEKGYGRVRFQGGRYYAHRVIFWLEFPNEINLAAPKVDRDTQGFLLHKCDNPICCNPSHLFVGSQLDNIRDRDSKNRHADFSGEKNPNSKFSKEQVQQMKQEKENGKTAVAIAKEHGVSYSCIKRLLRGVTYNG
jgi:hypothetical protein